MDFNSLEESIAKMNSGSWYNPMDNVIKMINSRQFITPPSPMETITRSLSTLQGGYRPISEIISKSIQNRLSQPTIFSIAEQLKARVNQLNGFKYSIDPFYGETIEEEEKIEIVDHAKKIIEDIYKDQRVLDSLGSRLFEEVVAKLLCAKGFEVELTQQTRDGGYDIIAINRFGGISSKMLVECKRWKRRVGISVIREFWDVIKEEKANKGLIVTTSYFSSESIKRKEREGHILDLYDRDCLIEWVNDYQLKI